ncbi:MAG: N-acetylmuramoyl-L-alanine amidase family protein [Limnochordia bacterium]
MRVLFHAMHVRHLYVFAMAMLLLAALPVAIAFGRAERLERRLSGWTVAIDAGHGGADKGAWFPQSGLVEKEINLTVAKTLAQQLEGEGFIALLIRTDDIHIELGERASKANTSRADIFVSIHVNRFPQDSRCRGAQTFYQSGSAAGRLLAVLVQQELRTIDPTNKREAIAADYKVLRESDMPGILVEIGFATNPRDRQLIMDPEYRTAIATAIRRGLVRYSQSRVGSRLSRKGRRASASSTGRV